EPSPRQPRPGFAALRGRDAPPGEAPVRGLLRAQPSPHHIPPGAPDSTGPRGPASLAVRLQPDGDGHGGSLVVADPAVSSRLGSRGRADRLPGRLDPAPALDPHPHVPLDLLRLRPARAPLRAPGGPLRDPALAALGGAADARGPGRAGGPGGRGPGVAEAVPPRGSARPPAALGRTPPPGPSAAP